MVRLALVLVLGGLSAPSAGPARPAAPAASAARAELTFVGPKSLTVQCVSGCSDDRVYLPERFPSLQVSESGGAVRLRFRAAGFRSSVADYALSPGRNRIVVKLSRAERLAASPW